MLIVDFYRITDCNGLEICGGLDVSENPRWTTKISARLSLLCIAGAINYVDMSYYPPLCFHLTTLRTGDRCENS